MGHLLFCVEIERRAPGEALVVTKIDTSEVEFEAGFQIVEGYLDDSPIDEFRCAYHIHFSYPLVPSHDNEIACEASIYGLSSRELGGICREAIACHEAMSDLKDLSPAKAIIAR